MSSLMAGVINRRDFLAYSGATLAGVTLGEAGRRWLARADERAGAWRKPAVETWATSVCRECPAACGVRVRLVDQTPVKLEGNPNCPISRGRLCAKGQAAIEAYFDPDRLVGPARRTGRRGEGQWAPISWNEAAALLAAALGRARADRGAIVALAVGERGPVIDAWTRFWTGVGGRVAWTLAPTAERLAPGFAALTGARGDPVFDIEHATHVLSFGAPVVEDFLSPVWAQRSYGRFRRGATRRRGRLVQVDPYRSLSARKADEWLPVAADRQAVLAYGIASVLLREDRVDRAFLAEFGGNAAAFEQEVLARYTPDNVALATGVSVVTLLRLGRELAATTEPLVVVAADAAPELVEAVFALNALVGSLDRPGGIFESATSRGEEPARASAVAELQQIVSGESPHLLALHDASPLRARAAPHDLGAAVERCELVVTFSPYLDETAALADLLLPTHTSLESWHAVVPPASDPTEKMACAKPATAARLDTRDMVGLLRAAAERLGDEALCPWKSDGDLLQHELDRLWTLRRGTPYVSPFESDWVHQLESGGWWVPPAALRRAFDDMILDAGGWVDPFFAPGGVRRALAQHGGLAFVPPAGIDPVSTAVTTRPSVLVESAEVALASARELPLKLVVFTPAAVNLVGGPNQPVLFELLGQPDGLPWQVWAELSPETARELDLSAGALIRIHSASGSIEARAVVVDRLPPGTIAVAYVPTPAAAGRWARLVAADLRWLWDGGEPAGSVAVRVARA